MLQALVILFFIVVALWALVNTLTSQRLAHKFVYNAGESPDKLNGLFPCDDVTVPYAGDLQTWPSVTVIVPGRNEGHVLRETLGSLCAMDYLNFRVVFIDDQSTDNTAVVCAELKSLHPHLTVIHNEAPPQDGWVGKNWAIHQARQFINDPTGGDYLLFTDSDLHFHRDALKQMIRLALHRQADFASMLPKLKARSLWEILGLLPAMVMITLHLPLYACNNPRDPRALAAGGFLLIKRTAYHTLGGHESVRGQMIEDIALCTRAKSQKLRVFTTLTHNLITARMYEGLRDTFRGLKKNAYAGANYNPLVAVLAVSFILAAGVLPPLYAIYGTYLWVTRPALVTFDLGVLGIASFVLLLARGTAICRMLGWWTITALLLPLGFLCYLLIFIASIFDYYRGGNTWAGRRIPSEHTRRIAQARVLETTSANPASSNPE